MEKPMAELSHTIKMKRNWFMSLFIWFWDCNGMRLNTCLIFWGTLFMIIGWPIRLFLVGLGTILRPLCKYVESRQKHDPGPHFSMKPTVTDEPKEPSRAARFLVGLLVYGERYSRRNKPKRHLIRRIYRAVHDHTCANIVIEP
jgi:hypothetical protein